MRLFYSNPLGGRAGIFTIPLTSWLGWIIYVLADFLPSTFAALTFGRFFCRLFFMSFDFFSDIKCFQYQAFLWPMTFFCSFLLTQSLLFSFKPMTFSCSMILTQSLFLSLDNDLLMFLPIDLINYSFDLTPSLLLFLFIDLNHHSFISSVTFCSFIFTSFIVPLIWPVTFFCSSIIVPFM